MKFLIFILSLYLLALPCMPCNDLHEQEQTSVITQKQNSNNTTHEDVCNPFCICTCCNMAVDAPLVVCCTSILVSPNSIFYNHFTQALQEQPNTCWQPPKLG